MSVLVQDILGAVASYINQDPTLPTGTDETMWINLINQSQNEWKDSYIWRKTLQTPYNPTVGASQTSLGLPGNFERLLSPVFDYSNGVDNPWRYFEIHPDERFLHASTDKYIYITGDDIQGKAMIFNPTLSASASISFDYLATPSSLVTLNDTVTCPSPQFLTSRSDPRFTLVFENSNTLLGHMMDDEAAPTGGLDNTMVSTLAKKGFRIGES
jgi:hypothetical protein